ncbi:MAG: hypothetical protein ACKVHP_09715, partial [Verrucomicrobiales bacterium]
LPTGDAEGAVAATASLSDLRLNEWLADPSPGFDDWIEVINTNAAAPVVLTGLHASVNGAMFIVSAPTALEPGGVIRLIADKGARSPRRFHRKTSRWDWRMDGARLSKPWGA